MSEFGFELVELVDFWYTMNFYVMNNPKEFFFLLRNKT